MRRWEDWERSRLRKLKRDERRRRDFERIQGSAFGDGGDMLKADMRSQYDGSDTMSLASDDDQWGTQIGGYNEHNVQYPPPPSGVLIPEDRLESAKTLDGSELEAMLEMGFDDRPAAQSHAAYAPRYQLADGSTSTVQLPGAGSGYAPLSNSPASGIQPLPNVLSPTSPMMNMGRYAPPRNDDWAPRAGPGGPNDSAGQRQATGERYGPLGPLDPSTGF